MSGISTMVVLLIVLVSYLPPVYLTNVPMPGGYSDLSVTDPQVVKAAEEAFAFYKKVTPRLDDFSLQEILKAEGQVVNGYNYKVEFRAEADLEGLKNLFSVCCHAVVNENSLDQSFKTLSVSCAPKLKQ